MTLFIKISSSEQQYNAGLLAALEINSPKHQAAIALGENYQNKLLLLVGHKELKQAVSIASEITARLKTEPWLANIYSNPLNSKQLQQLVSYYGASPFSYLASSHKETLNSALKNNQTKSLSDEYFSLLSQWADPIVSHSLDKDTTLTLATFLKERLFSTAQSGANWQFSQQEFMLKGDDFNYIPIFVNIKPEHTNIRDSVAIYQALQGIKANYSQISTVGNDSEVLMTGMVLHSAAASLQAQSEISSFGLFSLVGVIIIILLAFRAITPLIACLAVISSALLVGIVALTLWFDAIHLLAFVFAVSILGIAVDYGFHVLVLRQHTQESAQTIRSKVFLPLTIALVSTIAGYSLFFTTPINLLHQVVVFVGFGLVGAYLSALLLLPNIQFSSTGTSFAIVMKQRFTYLVIALAILFVSIKGLNFDDSIGNLNTKSSSLVQEEQKVAKLTGENVYPYMVLISGDNQDSLLQDTQLLSKTLRSQGAVLKSISDWQLPQTEQQKNIDLIKANWQSDHYSAIKPYLDDKAVESALLKAKPIALQPNFIAQNMGVDIKQVAEQYWTALLLNAPLTKEQKQSLTQVKDASYVNLPLALSEQLGEVRTNILQVAIPAVLVILTILSFYFGFASAFIMLLVPIVSAGLALVISQLFQASLNIFNILACLLIITLAIDYVVFFRAHGVTKLISHTISLSAISSALTFGVMTFSTTPAVSSFGLTLLLGISLAWLLSHLTPLNYIKK
ncbi:MAG: hypothetical protein OQK03_05015 [Colwellia sp.]|nr:hypothetical protein [Colwellia sp.]